MRIPGQALHHRITIEPSLGNTGDGDTYGTPVANIKAAVKTKNVISNDASGGTLSVWATCRIKPTVRVGGRAPAAGDRVTVNGQTRLLAAVEPVSGPGAALAYFELVAGDG